MENILNSVAGMSETEKSELLNQLLGEKKKIAREKKMEEQYKELLPLYNKYKSEREAEVHLEKNEWMGKDEGELIQEINRLKEILNPKIFKVQDFYEWKKSSQKKEKSENPVVAGNCCLGRKICKIKNPDGWFGFKQCPKKLSGGKNLCGSCKKSNDGRVDEVGWFPHHNGPEASEGDKKWFKQMNELYPTIFYHQEKKSLNLKTHNIFGEELEIPENPETEIITEEIVEDEVEENQEEEIVEWKGNPLYYQKGKKKGQLKSQK